MKLFGTSSGKHVARKTNEPRPQSAPKQTTQAHPTAPQIKTPAPQAKPATPQTKPAAPQQTKTAAPQQTKPAAPQVKAPAANPIPFNPAPPSGNRTAKPEPMPDIRFEPISKEAQAKIVSVQVDSEKTPAAEPQKEKKRSGFWTGYWVYVCVFLVLIIAALGAFRYWLNNYELSRPHLTMENYLKAADSAYWHDFLAAKGVEESFLETLDLNDTSYFKKVDLYTDEQPAYGIRFGDRHMLTTTLKPGRVLSFGETTWDVDTVELVKSGLTVYAPAGATLTVRGAEVSADCLMQENAQALTLGELEQGREDIPGLDRYELDSIFGNENLVVTDAEGNELPLSQRQGKRYYYAPLTRSWTVTAPGDATVFVNGVALSSANARYRSEPLEDFEGLEAWIDPIPTVAVWTVDGLVAEPEIRAELRGTELEGELDGERCVFQQTEDAAFAQEVRSRVLSAFDAYIAFSGNRGANLNANYSNYNSYLVPGSVAAERAKKALDSLYWVKGRDTALQTQELREIMRYGEDCFTALIDYTLNVDGSIGENSTLFIFIRYNGGWSLVNILNKSTVV